jgi:CDP-6-deoxy-D-xylo-4-hexulose-3-dehydrase
MRNPEEIRSDILSLVREYHDSAHRHPPVPAGEGRIPYGGRVFDEKELCNLVDSSLEFWLTAGRYCAELEERLASYVGVRHCLLTTSGSSANLLAVAALTSPTLGERALRRGDEVVTVAAGFPTTVAPILQHGMVPVFVDVTLPTYNVDAAALEEALSPRTRAVMLAHTLGNPFDVDAVSSFCRRHGLWFVEDNCDALGSLWRGKRTGGFGHIATQSFYPPHHMTTGEGGALFTDDPALKRLVESFRDWGRDCWCPPGKDDTCGRRHTGRFGELPPGYDHKYVYSHFGYNLRMTDLQAAIGCAQVEKLPAFTEARKRNFRILREGLAGLEERLVLPEATDGADPSWFGFLLTVRGGGGATRDSVVGRLEGLGIQTRTLFAGNLLRHPCFDGMRKSGEGYRVVGDLAGSDRILNDSFWVGVYPGITEDGAAWMAERIREAVTR